MGTIGSIVLLKDKLTKTFFLTNCDILVNLNFDKILKQHKKNKSDLTIIVSKKEFMIPYGVCNINPSGNLKNISEKPKFEYLINTGLYIFEPNIIDLLSNTKINMDKFIKLLKFKKKRIGVYKIQSKDWLDVGEWKKYRESVDVLENKLNE